MFDLIGFWETHSTPVTIAVLLGLALLCLGIKELRDQWKNHKRMWSSILSQEDSIKDDDEQTVIYRREVLALVSRVYAILDALQKKADDHYADVERLASEDHWKNCNVDKCPNLPTLLASMKQTNDTLSEIVTLLRQLIIEIIATLRSFRNGSPKRGGDDAA